MPTDRIRTLIGLYFNETINDAEIRELSRWVTKHASDEELATLLQDCWSQHHPNVIMPEMASQNIISSILNPVLTTEGSSIISLPPATANSNTKIVWLKRISVAASIIIVFTIGYFKFTTPSMPHIEEVASLSSISEIKPGGQKALLTLSDGSQIILDSASNGLLTQQGNTKVIKLANGKLQYASSAVSSGEVLYNTMSTPPGGQYQLVLPDQSRVWLNASSSVRYPTSFLGKERMVQITGEAYFEVAKNATQPFIVKTARGQEVRVLGTHFNINEYSDEPEVKTSLLEGSIRLTKDKKNVLLTPGNQAHVNTAGEIKIVANADMEEAIAWKNGSFQFNSADIHTVMRQAARWYNIEVEYKGIPANENRFTGKIPMSVNLSRLLKWMEWSDIRFELKGKKLIIFQ